MDDVLGVGVVAEEDQRLDKLHDRDQEVVSGSLVLKGDNRVLGVEGGQNPVPQLGKEMHRLPTNAEGVILGSLVGVVLLQLIPVVDELT